MKKTIFYAVIIFCFFMFTRAEAAIFDVNDVAGFQSALTTAQGNGEDDIINLAPGTYMLAGSWLDYFPNESESSSLTILGSGAETTILDGGNLASILRIDQSGMLDPTNANILIAGITFRKGSETSQVGGALYIGNDYAQTTVQNCVFQDNATIYEGGALYVSGGTVHIAGNTFTGNSSADSSGGALYAVISGGILVLDGNIFSGNGAEKDGGGVYVSAEFGSTVTITGNTFDGNSATSAGGASVSCQGSAIISGNIFSDNIASTSSASNGGGLIAYSQDSLTIQNNLFFGNKTSEVGGGALIYIFNNQNQITNNTFVGNSSTGIYDKTNSLGGGAYIITYKNTAVANLYNNIIWSNTATAPGANGSDLYIDDDGLNVGTGSTINLYNNDFSVMTIRRGNNLHQGGNINADPNLNSGYQLQAGSPCIDAGNNSAPDLPATDLAGNSRIYNGIVDMGAYESGQVGSLRVLISPQGAIDAGAQWRVDGGAWHNSGESETPPAGNHTVEFSDIGSAWTNPGSQTVTISEGVGATVTGTYVAPSGTGTLQVTILPAGVTGYGAQWRVDGGLWQASGYIQTVAAGSHTLQFSDVCNLGKPADQTVTITAGGSSTRSGTYSGSIGSLKVTIGPQGAVDAGAKWQVDGGVWNDSGYTQGCLTAGQHTVEFKDNVPGWRQAPPQTVTIVGWQTKNVSGNYTFIPPGSLKVTILPQQANSGGAQWRVDTGDWHNSGYQQDGLVQGLHKLEFKPISGWTKPGDPTVTITGGEVTTFTGYYTFLPDGYLSVTIMPQSAIDLGAQWRVDGGSWNSSGFMEQLGVGSHTVDFSPVAGWAAPDPITVTIESNKTKSTTGTYVEKACSVTGTITPPEAVTAGAKWRVDSGVWNVTGYQQDGVSLGQHTVQFSDVGGWDTPASVTVTCTIVGEVKPVSGNYVQQFGSLTATITFSPPPDVIPAGAQWRRVGTTTWRNSGETEANITVGQYSVEFTTVTGWSTPASVPVTIVKNVLTPVAGTYTLDYGSLKVTLGPAGAVTAGAKWRRQGTSPWMDSGSTETGILVGTYMVEFMDISNWTTPAPVPVTITKNTATNASGAYVWWTGSLTVTIAPPEAVTGGAKWRRQGTGTYRDSGATEAGIPVGTYYVEFSAVSGYTTPATQMVTVTKDATISISVTYLPPSGCLQYYVAPQGAIDAGATWRVDGGAWHGSGETQCGLSPGYHPVDFSAAGPNWTPPLMRNVNIVVNRTTILTGTYIVKTGYLRVTISPPEAASAGAQWRRVGTSTWRSSGDTETAVPMGDYTVEYSDLPSWAKPASQTVTISWNKTTTATGIYILLTGNLQVTISPQAAVTAGAQWRRVGTTTWLNSGDTETAIPVGQYNVEFSTIPNWTKPVNVTVTINQDQTSPASAMYTQGGNLKVTITPSGAITAGAQWRRVGTETWRDSGTMETGIPPGRYTVEFSHIPNWTEPASRSILISNNMTTNTSGTYIPWTGSLQVMITPQEAIDAGAQWRVDGGTWHLSGDTQTGLLVGQHTVEFSDISLSSWAKPGTQTVTISNGLTTTVTGAYIPPSGSLQVIISPQAAIDAGARWRVDGGTWHGSGETQPLLSVGYHTVEFSTLTGWTKPASRTVKINLGLTTTLSLGYSQ